MPYIDRNNLRELILQILGIRSARIAVGLQTFTCPVLKTTTTFWPPSYSSNITRSSMSISWTMPSPKPWGLEMIALLIFRIQCRWVPTVYNWLSHVWRWSTDSLKKSPRLVRAVTTVSSSPMVSTGRTWRGWAMTRQKLGGITGEKRLFSTSTTRSFTKCTAPIYHEMHHH